MMNSVIVAVGSNIDPYKNIAKLKYLVAKKQSFLKTASLLKTIPMGYINQPFFVNTALFFKTAMSYALLYNWLKYIENCLGRPRKRNSHYGPRTMDLDIVIWNDKIVDSEVEDKDFIKKLVLELVPDLNLLRQEVYL